MLQVYLDVSKVDRVLHLTPRFLLPRLGVSFFFRRQLGIRRAPPPLLDASNVRGGVGPV